MVESSRRLTKPLDDEALRVGALIRERRRALGMTLKDIAQKAGLSHGFVSLVERGRTRPSMPSFTRLARALQSTPVDILLQAQSPSAGAGIARYGQVDGRIVYEQPGRIRVIEVVTDADRSDGYQRHAGYAELLVVLDGELEVTFPDRTERLSSGQSIRYEAGTEHNWRALTDEPVRMLMMHIS